MTELAFGILKQCLLPQTIAGTAGNRPHWRGTFFYREYEYHAQIRSADHVGRLLDLGEIGAILKIREENLGPG